MLLAEYEAKVYNELFNTSRNDTLLLRVNVFARYSKYKKACKKAGSKFIPSSGMYYPNLKQCFVYKHPEFKKTVIHEMGHGFMHHNMMNPPRWLNEGISEFFESLTIVNGKITVSQQSRRVSNVATLLKEGNLDLSEFLKSGQNKWADKSSMNEMYNIAYSLVFYIMKTNPDNLTKLVSLLQKKRNSIAAIESVFGSFDNFVPGYTKFYSEFVDRQIQTIR